MKKCVKVIILLLIVAVIIGVMPNIVRAAETTEETLQKMIDVLPNEMNIDLKESEYDKVSNVVEQKVKEIWNENGIDVQGLEEQGYHFEVSAGYLYLTLEQFYQADIYIEYINEDGSISSTGKEKTIQLIYSNHDNYNKNDEQTVKQLTLPALPEYVTYGFDIEDVAKGAKQSISEYYENAVNDKSIKIIASSGAWGDHLLDFGFHGIRLAIFKNDILYDIRYAGNIPTICQMVLPSSVGNAEEDYINYALALIKDYWKEICNNSDGELQYSDNIVLVKEDSKIENYYNIKCDGEEIGSIILKKENIQNILKEDENTGIKIETTSGVLSSNIKLSSIIITEQTTLDTVKTSLTEISDKYVAYDITLLEDNVKVQPNGKVKVSIPIPNDYNKEKLAVYRIADNGEKTKYDVKVEENYATFETDHFSTYVLAEVADGNSTTTNNDDEKELDETPKTGTINVIYYVLPVAIISAIGIVLFRKNK